MASRFAVFDANQDAFMTTEPDAYYLRRATLASNQILWNSMIDFVRSVLEGTSTVVPPWKESAWRSSEVGGLIVGSADQIEELLIQADASRRMEAPGRPPQLDLSAAMWGAELLHWACWSIVERTESNVSMSKHLRSSMPDTSKPESHWSIDLMMAAWPDVSKRCHSASAEDPLMQTLHSVAVDWPMAAVGMKQISSIADGVSKTSEDQFSVKPEAIRTVLQHATLRRVMVDRAIRYRDAKWLAVEEIAVEVKRVAGQHQNLLD